jgi:hypothetical protein
MVTVEVMTGSGFVSTVGGTAALSKGEAGAGSASMTGSVSESASGSIAGSVAGGVGGTGTADWLAVVSADSAA